MGIKTIRCRVPMAPSISKALAVPATPRTRGSARMSTRQRIFERDHGLCQECRRQGRWTACLPSAPVDHIVPLHLGGSDADSNQELLCPECHEVKTQRERAERAGGRSNLYGS